MHGRYEAWSAAVHFQYQALSSNDRNSWITAWRAWTALALLYGPNERDHLIYEHMAAQAVEAIRKLEMWVLLRGFEDTRASRAGMMLPFPQR